jgi:hypothetical protein
MEKANSILSELTLKDEIDILILPESPFSDNN